MESKTGIRMRASRTTRLESFFRRWPAAAGFTGTIALMPASIASLTVPGRFEFLNILGMLGLWFIGAGVSGGTAIAMQHAFRQPRVVAPLFAAGIVLLIGGILWISTGLLDPGSHGRYTLAVVAPFVLTLVVVTSTAVLIPARYRKGFGTVFLVASVVIAILGAVT